MKHGITWRWLFEQAHSELIYSVLCGKCPPSQYFAWMYFHAPFFKQLDMNKALNGGYG